MKIKEDKENKLKLIPKVENYSKRQKKMRT